MKTRQAVRYAVSLLLLLCSMEALAYDSKYEARMLLPAREFQTTPWVQDVELLRYEVVHHAQVNRAIGDGRAEWLAFPGLYVCPSVSRLADGGVDLDLCRPLGPPDLPVEQPPGLPSGSPSPVDIKADARLPGWLTARLSWNHGSHSEHRAVTERAAEAAGLLSYTNIFETFYARYPAGNEVTGTQLGSGEFVVGQSWVPRKHELAEAYVTRGISLLDLSQLADFSHSLEDWANGNEICPIGEDIEGAYAGSHNRACHDFAKAMGALNATHFKPLSQSVYAYYHQLAMYRMEECSALALRLPSPDLADEVPDQVPHYSFARTDLQWCEKEAMAYEMHAQHFLQDTWSTGHMWRRWGATELRSFPFLLEGEVEEEIPEANKQARRGSMASAVAAFSGMIHGSRALLEEQAEKYFPPLLGTPALEDALSSPRYARYEWVSGMPTPGSYNPPVLVEKPPGQVKFIAPDGSLLFGAGDLYFQSHLLGNEEFAPQKDRMMQCAAASLRQVYQAGPRSHGNLEADPETGRPAAPDAYAGRRFDDIDPVSEDCFGQWVTNESMSAAWGASSWWYFGGVSVSPPSLLKSGVWNRGNDLVLGEIQSAFPSGGPELEADKEAFFQKLGKRFDVEGLAVKAVFVANAKADAEGVESAQLKIMEEGKALNELREMTFLGVEPNTAPADVLSGQKPTPYADEQHVGGEMGALQRMFSRGRVKEVCDETGGDTSPLLALRQRCIDNSALRGGEYAACTACVEVAALHIPTLVNPLLPLPPSRCETVGGKSLRDAVGPDAVSWWYANGPRAWATGQSLWDELVPDEPWDEAYTDFTSAENVATVWCTGTAQAEGYVGNSSSRNVKALEWVGGGPTDSEVCHENSTGGTRTHVWGDLRVRYASMDSEGDGLFPDVGNVEVVNTIAVNPYHDRCFSFTHTLTTSDYDELMLHDMPFLGDGWAEQKFDAHLLNPWPNPQLAAPKCGHVARELSWNLSCEEALQRYGSHYFDLRGYWGTEAFPDGYASGVGCTVVEPITRSVCPEGESDLFCDAAGRCQGAPRLSLE